ncbi:MAG TPA: hypothetical protein HA260_04245 [Thermoplasmata archaeon]|jgi:hypothetical protein|nr:hypothetical protein [Thermoplasmata archaeon]
MKSLKGCFKLIIVCIMIIAIFFPVAVFIHEATHSLLYTMEGIPVTSFHILDSESFRNGNLGYVTTIQESRYGAFFHEGTATIVGSLFIITTLLFFLLVPFKPFTVRQLHAMGLKRTTHQFSLKN